LLQGTHDLINTLKICDKAKNYFFGINIYDMDANKKVKFSLCLAKHDAMKTYGEVRVVLCVFLTLARDGVVVSFTSSCFTHGEKAPGTQWIGD
jgi:hypothetical protein